MDELKPRPVQVYIASRSEPDEELCNIISQPIKEAGLEHRLIRGNLGAVSRGFSTVEGRLEASRSAYREIALIKECDIFVALDPTDPHVSARIALMMSLPNCGPPRIVFILANTDCPNILFPGAVEHLEVISALGPLIASYLKKNPF